MSTLKVTTIQDTAGSNSSTTSAIANGIAKAWVNFNGTGVVAINADYNVDTITDNGTGDYTINFTTALADANYAITSGGQVDTSGVDANRVTLGPRRFSGSMAAGNVRVYSGATNSSTATDNLVNCLTFLR